MEEKKKEEKEKKKKQGEDIRVAFSKYSLTNPTTLNAAAARINSVEPFDRNTNGFIKHNMFTSLLIV